MYVCIYIYHCLLHIAMKIHLYIYIQREREIRMYIIYIIRSIYYHINILSYYYIIMLLCYYIIILLYYYIIVLLYYYIVILLYCYIITYYYIIISYYCIIILLYYYIILYYIYIYILYHESSLVSIAKHLLAVRLGLKQLAKFVDISLGSCQNVVNLWVSQSPVKTVWKMVKMGSRSTKLWESLPIESRIEPRGNQSWWKIMGPIMMQTTSCWGHHGIHSHGHGILVHRSRSHGTF